MTSNSAYFKCALGLVHAEVLSGSSAWEHSSSTQDLREGAELTAKQLGYTLSAAHNHTESTAHTAEEETLRARARRQRVLQ